MSAALAESAESQNGKNGQACLGWPMYYPPVRRGEKGRHRTHVVRPAFVKRGIWVVALAIVVALLGPSKLPPPAPSQAAAAGLPGGFQEKTVFSGLTNPTNIAFAPGGQVFVAEKSGIIKVYDNLSDPTPTVFADLNVSVYNF